jgi:uncharacterized protein (DUF2252 family)
LLPARRPGANLSSGLQQYVPEMKNKSKNYPSFAERSTVLRQGRNLKMASSAHAYVRGNTLKFYQWLADADNSRVPEGPPVWICGDCHVGNLGPLAATDGQIDIQIRDLDQSTIGNPAHDLIRLGLSLAMAARGSDLPGVTTAKMIEQLTEGYEEALAERDTDVGKKPDCVQVVMRRAVKRTWAQLAAERLEDTKPTIPLGKSFWPLTSDERRGIELLFATEEASRLATSLHSRKDDAVIEVLDAAYWVKGCSSLGRLRFAVLLGVGTHLNDDGALCLMDIKEAVPAIAPCLGNLPQDDAVRVVTGARHLSPALGERMIAARLLDKPVFLRELLPQDLKLEIPRLTREEAMKSARYLAIVVGEAHARQMDHSTRGEWRKQLTRDRVSGLDAPSWLWSSVVELVANHEAAYLEHCRRYALEGAQ